MEVEELPKIYRFPVFYQSAAAGIGKLTQVYDYNMQDFTIDAMPENAVFAMKISGESMNSYLTNHIIKTNSIVLINPRFNVSDLDDKIVIAKFKNKVICKRYIDKGNYILFQSDNDDYSNENRKSSDDPECRIVGIVLGVIENNKFIEVK